MRQTVNGYVRICELCQKSKISNQNYTGIMKSIIPKNENELIAVDLFGPLPSSIAGVRYIFVVLNVFTKFVKLYKLKKPTARAIIAKLENDYFINIRKPDRILSDNGTQFTSKEWNYFLLQNKIANLHCTIRHPQSNPSERIMREIGRLLRIYCHNKHTAWAKYTNKIETLINCTVHESTEMAPITLELGKLPNQEVRKLITFPDQQDKSVDMVVIRAKLQSKAEARQARHNKDKRKFTNFEEGQLVWLRANHISSADDGEIKKLFMIYEGPYKIKKVIGHNAYKLIYPENGKVRGNFNTVHLKPHIGSVE